MGKKGGKHPKKENGFPPKKNVARLDSDDDMMNDEIDAFHKQRDVVPLNINEDADESDEDTEQPVFDFEDDEDEDDEIEDDDKPPKGLEAKIVRTQKYLRDKFGGVEDEDLDDAEEEEQEMGIWGRKEDLYGGDVDYEQSSDDDDAAAEEAEVLRLQSEKAKALSLADYGLEDSNLDKTEMEPTFEEILDHGKPAANASLNKVNKEDAGITYEIVKKDLNALTKEEQMNVVYSSAPELVGLLSELNDALEELENKVNPLLNKIGGRESGKKGEMHYMEVKQLLLHSFCQAITFYLLLKSEGHPVRDHPVVSRLVEIKSLLDKMREMDANLPFDIEDIVKKDTSNVPAMKLVEESAPESDSLINSQMLSRESEKHPIVKPNEVAELDTLRSSKINELEHKPQDKKVGIQSMEMLKVRAALEEKLKQKGVFSSITPKSTRERENKQPVNSQLETLDDYNDDAMDIDNGAHGRSNGDASLSNLSKISRHLTVHQNKRKFVSGDDDIPKRDDIGERRRKHELRVLAGAGIKSFDGGEDDFGNLSSDGAAADTDGGTDTADSDLEYYKEVERQHAAKIAAKSEKYSRTPEVAPLEEDTVGDGKRHITRQIEKNRGLTRARKKLTKNPRKKYKLKHQKAEVRRKGQVRAIRKPAGPYGGEASGINAGISRSVRFKS